MIHSSNLTLFGNYSSLSLILGVLAISLELGLGVCTKCAGGISDLCAERESFEKHSTSIRFPQSIDIILERSFLSYGI